MLQSHTPTVVVDWGWIRSWKAATVEAPAEIMICEPMLSEACTAEQDMRYKLFEFLRRHEKRMVVARWPKLMIESEFDPYRMASFYDAIDLPRTAKTRVTPLSLPSKDRIDEYRQRTGAMLDYWTSKEGLVEFIAEWAQRMKEKDGESGKTLGGVDAFTKCIRDPKLTCGFAAWWMNRFQDSRWQDSLNCFPDRTAVGRLLRTHLWYLLQSYTGRKIEQNDWEDQHYAFYAAFTGNIATLDRNVKRLVNDCFPDVRIHQSECILVENLA